MIKIYRGLSNKDDFSTKSRKNILNNLEKIENLLFQIFYTFILKKLTFHEITHTQKYGYLPVHILA